MASIPWLFSIITERRVSPMKQGYRMALSRGLKRPITNLLNLVNAHHYFSRMHASGVGTALIIPQVGDFALQLCRTNDSSQHYCGGGTFLSRRFTAGPSVSDHLNLIRQLRERTSAPIKDVKSALISCSWDIDAAQKELRKRGIILASKKSSRIAAEGLLALAQTETKAAVIELNCETDFVARNEIFQYLALSLARTALFVEGGRSSMGSFLTPEHLGDVKINFDHPKLNGEITAQSAITEVAAMVGENIKLRRGFAMSTSSHGIVSSYLHTCPQPGLGRIAGILTLESNDKNISLDTLQKVGSSLAMHIVAAKPLFLSKELVSSEAIESERDILKTQAESTGKSQMAIEKMVEGRLRKYFEEVVFLEQKFVMNDTTNVKSILKDLSEEVGSSVKIGKFFRMEVGEGTYKVEAEAMAKVA